jgi:chemotaxis protein MotB
MRSPQYLRPARDGRERWLVSYTDILTLLLILFITMAAQAIGQANARAAAQKQDPQTPKQETPKTNVDAVPPTLDHNEPLARMADRLKQNGLDANLESRGLLISLPQAVLFASGDDHISLSAQPIVADIAGALRESDNKVELAGHADSTPIHNRRFSNNWELSAARGLSLLRVLTADYGIDESRLTVSSYGAFRPKESNDTADGRAENRRVEILIMNQ